MNQSRRNEVTPAVRQKLDIQRLARQQKRAARIAAYMTYLADMVSQCSHARDMRMHLSNGCLSFRYSGRSVQYWVGTETLVIKNAVSSTVYKDFPPNDLVAMLQDNNPNNAFKVEPA